MDDIVGAMSYKTQKSRATLSADVYTYGDGEFFTTIKVSRVFRDDILSIEASDILEEELELVFSELEADTAERLCPDLQDVRLSWD